MLKRIDVADVRLGMFIHKLEGNWLKHPFWRTKFLLTDADQLADLHASEVEGVLIDIEKGADVGGPRPPATPARRRPLVSVTTGGVPPSDRIEAERRRAVTSAPAPRFNAVGFDSRSTSPVSIAREVGHARAVLARSSRILAAVIEQARLGRAISLGQVEPIIDDLFASVQRNPHAFNGLMRVRRENMSLYAHALAVSALMIALARQLGFKPESVREAGLAGLLMDVGMGHLPIDVSTIFEDLSAGEREVVQTHTRLGHDFLKLGGEMSEAVTQVCLDHHERFDGSGYPRGIAGEEIGLLGRMAAICDVYDSLTSDRPHRPRIDPNAALTVMTMDMTGQFDPDLLAQFIECIGIYPVGSVVRLTTDRLALVVDQNSEDHTRPRVWSFYDIGSRSIVKPEDLDLRLWQGRCEIIGSDDASLYDIPNFPALREMVFTSACKTMH